MAMLQTVFSGLMLWEPMLRHLRGRAVGVIVPHGNVGDEFILHGTRSLFSRAGIDAVYVRQHEIERMPPVEVVAWGGGGNVAGRYKYDSAVRQGYEVARKWRASYICLPQSIEWRAEVLRLFDEVFLREVTSVAMEPKARLVPDLALANQLPMANPEVEFQQVFRGDSEATGKHAANDPRRGMSLDEFIKLAGRARVLETDLLHLAVCALLQGCRVAFHDCNWHKNRAIFKTWLHYFDGAVMA